MRLNERWGLDREALERRLGKGAKVALVELDENGIADVQELLGHYAVELDRSEQPEEAARIRSIAADPARNFLMSVPEREQTDPSVSTE
jgi:glutamate synthase (NADPH/NADH) large chain